MKILIVNYFYAPTIDAHAYRWTQISQYWAAQGFDVEIITGKVKGASNNATESGVKVRRIGFISKSNAVGVNSTKPSFLNAIKNKIINILRPVYRKIYWPDALWHWFPYVFLEMLRRRREKYDLIISYYPCYSAHLAVRILKKISRNSKFRWILDYGDPFCTSETWQPNNYAIYDPLNRSIELNCSKHGEMVFTNFETAAAYKDKLKVVNDFKIIPHLGDVCKFYAGSHREITGVGRVIKLCYIGAFHPRIREPFRLFKLIRKIVALHGLNIKLEIYGSANGFDLDPADCPEISYYGNVEREKAISLLKDTDFIITVDNENCVMTPSKNVECIATGRPVINIANPSVSYAPMNNYIAAGYAIAVFDKDISDAAVSDVYSFILKHHGAGIASVSTIKNVLHAHLLETVADSYLN